MSAVADEPEAWAVVSSATKFTGAVVELRVDTLESDGKAFDREVVMHPGAVAIAALDDDDRVLVLSQYRHAAGLRMVELPAGLLDVEGESPLAAAKRELREEGAVEAAHWRHLLDYFPSPGMSTEQVRIYWATGIRPVDQTAGFQAEHEEAVMSRGWVALDDLVAAVLGGTVRNGHTVIGSLALSRMNRSERLSWME